MINIDYHSPAESPAWIAIAMPTPNETAMTMETSTRRQQLDAALDAVVDYSRNCEYVKRHGPPELAEFYAVRLSFARQAVVDLFAVGSRSEEISSEQIGERFPSYTFTQREDILSYARALWREARASVGSGARELDDSQPASGEPVTAEISHAAPSATVPPTAGEISDAAVDAVRKEFWNETLGEGWHYDVLSMCVEIAHLRQQLKLARSV